MTAAIRSVLSRCSLSCRLTCTSLFVTLGLPTPKNPAKNETWVFINGGSSSVGHFAVQLSKLAGLKVITTAGGGGEVEV